MGLIKFKNFRISKKVYGEPSASNHAVLLKRLFDVMCLTAFNAAKSSFRLGLLAKQISTTNDNVQKSLENTNKIEISMKQIHLDSNHALESTAKMLEQAHQGQQSINLVINSSHLLNENVKNASERMSKVLSQIPKIYAVSEVVESIAFQSKLLGYNAAVEAARAGEYGHGFLVVAEEIRKLAQDTAHQTQQIKEVLNQLKEDLDPAQKSIDLINRLSQENNQNTDVLFEVFKKLNEQVKTVSEQTSTISELVRNEQDTVQSASLQMNKIKESSAQMNKEVSSMTVDFSKLSLMTEKVYSYFDQVNLDTEFQRFLNKGRQLSYDIAEMFERKILDNELTLAQILSLKYDEIKGDKVNSLSRLFDVSRVSRNGFNPPKFSTEYDDKVDKDLMLLFDKIKNDEPGIAFCLAIDLNAYAPAHNKEFTKDWTNDSAKDLVANRTKRFFHDNGVLVKGARLGLGESALKLPMRAERSDFVRAGINLNEFAEAKAQYLVQTYFRDTGAIMTCLTVPIYVQGHRWGAVLMGWNAQEG